MAETLRELVVALLLDSSNFSRNMRSFNQQILVCVDECEHCARFSQN